MYNRLNTSSLDVQQWRWLCTVFNGAFINLSNSMALVTKRIGVTFVHPECISPFLACYLITLDKNLGVCPVAISDTARRISAKEVLDTIKPDVQDSCGCVQLCGKQISGDEVAVHADVLLSRMETRLYSWLMQLMHSAPLHNIQRIRLSLSAILISIYRAPSGLFVDGDTLLSQERTTKDDPLALLLYAMATILLIQKLECSYQQVWFTDNAGAVGRVEDLSDWWERLSTTGTTCKYGCFPNNSKTWLVIKEGLHETACSIFANTSVNVTCSERHYLGVAISNDEYVAGYVRVKDNDWIANLQCLAMITETQPHAGFWYLHTGWWTTDSRSVPGIGTLLRSLHHALHSVLVPA